MSLLVDREFTSPIELAVDASAVAPDAQMYRSRRLDGL
ncbi:hypothetical protein I548_3470 [Mycobacterium intracellulare]|nr:hypothetical protein I548_3470 [Mycobacterium intracellulare]